MDYKEIIKQQILSRYNDLYQMGYTWTSIKMKEFSRILYFGDRYWTPKLESIQNNTQAIKFLNLWFWINKKNVEKTYSKDPQDKNRIEMLNDLNGAEWIVMNWLDEAIKNEKNKNIRNQRHSDRII